jgi:hypothetical protein
MAWTNPATPVTLTTITTAFWNVNARDNLNVLRANTGSGDPTIAGQIAVATGPGVTAWGTAGTASLTDGAVTPAKLDRAYLPLTGGTIAGPVTLSTGGLDVTGGIIARTSQIIVMVGGIVVQAGGIAVTGGAIISGGIGVTGNSTFHDELTFDGNGEGVTFSSGTRIHDTSSPERHQIQAAGGRLDIYNEAGTIQLAQFGPTVGLTLANGMILTGGLVLSNGLALAGAMTIDNATLVTNLNADMVDSKQPGSSSGDLAILGAGGKVALAVAADTATSATSATTAATATNANALGGVAPAGYSLVPTSGTYNGDNSTTTVNTGLGSRLKLVILQKTSGPTSDRAMWIFIGDEAIQLTPGSGVGTVTGTFTTGSFAISLAAGTNVGGVSYRWVALG